MKAPEVLCLFEVAWQGKSYDNMMFIDNLNMFTYTFPLDAVHLAGWLSLDCLSFYFEDNCSTRGVGRPWVETLYVANLFFFLRQAQLSEANAPA